jgi:hypothetical protein
VAPRIPANHRRKELAGVLLGERKGILTIHSNIPSIPLAVVSPCAISPLFSPVARVTLHCSYA